MKKLQAVILAAGKSTRMQPLTCDLPKPLLDVVGKSILERNLEQLHLTQVISEVIIVVGFMKEAIISTIGDKYKDITIRYVEQKELNGSGGAIMLCEEFLRDRFLVLNGDDLYSYHDLKRSISRTYSVASHGVKDASLWGIVESVNGELKKIVEKPKYHMSNQANIGLYSFDIKIFKYSLSESSRGEYEITDYVNTLLSDDVSVGCFRAKDYWLPVGYPWQYLEACSFFLRQYSGKDIHGEIEQNVVLNGHVYIDRGTLVMSGCRIEGPVHIGRNCIIGPNAYLRKGTIIMDGVTFNGEVKESVIMDNVKAKHNCYIGYSVIGENSNIAAGTVTADYRHDGKEHISLVKKEKIRTGRNKLGAFLGTGVKTGVNTSIYPGRKIWPGKYTLPGRVVKEDIK